MSISDATQCRSALYMPASNPKVLAKGPLLQTDAVIIDLEDSVAPTAKSVAREQASSALINLDYGYRLRALRINASNTPWHADDIAAVATIKPDAVVLPKVESADDILFVSAALDQFPDTRGIAIWAMMESPLAIVNAAEIAACSQVCPRLTCLLIGNNDMARASNMPVTSDRTYLLPWLMTLVAAAKAYSLSILDGVYNDFADTVGFRAECEQGVAMGMDGKTLIHPSQLAIANAVYSPADADITQAKSVVAAFAHPDNVNAGVLQIDGRMIERLHLGMAEQLLIRAAQLAARK